MTLLSGCANKEKFQEGPDGFNQDVGMIASPAGWTGNLPEDEPRLPDRTDLCLAWERGVNLWAEEAARRENFDESKVRKYTLPPLPDTREEWEKQRPAILQQFKDCIYGEMPPPPDRLELKLLSERNDALNGLALRREYRVYCKMNNGRSFDFDLMLYVPKTVKKPPVFVYLCGGNHYQSPEDDVRISRGAVSTKFSWHNLSTSRQRGKGVDCYTLAVKRGYAVASAAFGEIFPDNLDGFRKSIFRLFYDDVRPDHEVALNEWKVNHRRRNFGGIGGWSWGNSRIVDALEKIGLTDPECVAVIGQSRLGKTSLWTGANDPRFKLVCVNNSGCCGAALARRNFGENMTQLWMVRSNWVCDRMVRYAGLEDELPVDQHQLIALVAPRAICVGSSSRDLNADPKGEFLATREAAKVWKFYGYRDLGVREMPPVNQVVGDRIRYFVKEGKHSLTLEDWGRYFDFADELFGKKSSLPK